MANIEAYGTRTVGNSGSSGGLTQEEHDALMEVAAKGIIFSTVNNPTPQSNLQIEIPEGYQYIVIMSRAGSDGYYSTSGDITQVVYAHPIYVNTSEYICVRIYKGEVGSKVIFSGVGNPVIYFMF